jgi:hypothetical protein
MVENNENCEQVWREISNYIDGEVNSSLRSLMDEHFRTCKKCASVLAGTRNVIQLYGDERMLEVPVGFGRRLEKRLAKNSAVKGSGWSTWSAWLVPAAAMILIVGSVAITNSLTFRSFVQSRHAQPANHVPPDMIVVVSSGAKLFHVPGCEYIHDKASERTMTAKQATEQGFVPCPRCLRQYLKTSGTRSPGPQVAEAGVAESDEGEEPEESIQSPGH